MERSRVSKRRPSRHLLVRFTSTLARLRHVPFAQRGVVLPTESGIVKLDEVSKRPGSAIRDGGQAALSR